MSTRHPTTDQLESRLDSVRAAPSDTGSLALIVRRPAVDERELLEEGELHPDHGLVGDTWKDRGSSRTEDGSAHPDMQLNVMNARAAAMVADSDDVGRWALAGDQLYLDFDISATNAPPGTRLTIGEAIIEVTAEKHTGCKKFSARFGADAWRFVNSEVGMELKLRGVNARVVRPGTIRRGDAVRKVVEGG
jgi:hypothetical protein